MYRVCLEVLDYHRVCRADEIKPYLKTPLIPEDKIPASFYSFQFHAHGSVGILPNLFLNMVVDLFGKNAFEMNKLMKFILTVRKNYR